MRVSTRSEDYTDLIRCLSTWHLTSCHSGSSHSSELEFEGELDRAGAANLVERVEAAIGAAGAEAACQRLCRVAEQRTGQHVAGIAEVRVVKDVEELGSETKFHLFGEVKLPLQPNIRLRCAETAQHVAAEITLLPSRRRGESCLIENLAARKLRSIEHKRPSRVHIRTGSEDDASSKRSCANYVYGRGRPGQNESVQRPSAHQGMDKLLRSQRGQIIGHAGREGMPDVKLELPPSTFGLAIVPGVLTFPEVPSEDAISIECEKIYDANPCNPLDKRLWNLSCKAW